VNHKIYAGWVRHRRYAPRKHQFRYGMFLLSLDIDDLQHNSREGFWFGVNKPALLSFLHKDYLDGKGKLSRHKVWDRVASLGGQWHGGKVYLLGQMRCLGVYFSPVNFYYCHDQSGKLRYLLAEVSNTPWNERHCYLVNAEVPEVIEKEFHVSPFMDEDMDYHWRFTPLNPRLYLHIENHLDDDNALQVKKLFDATLVMNEQPFTRGNLIKNVLRIPSMTIKTMVGIHWEALKLFAKRIPYIPYVSHQKETI